jgi:hypothetical protein
MIQRVLACATGITLYFRWPWPQNDLMLRLIALRWPMIYLLFRCSYTLFPFTHTFMYLKPYHNGVNKSYFRQFPDGEL